MEKKIYFFRFYRLFVLKTVQIYGESLLNLHYSFYSVNGVHESNLTETVLKSDAVLIE